jgi:branched-chain amino acid transport system ATP-binding protein
MVHVLEGRHVFAQLTVEDNLRSGGFVRGLGRQDMARIWSASTPGSPG